MDALIRSVARNLGKKKEEKIEKGKKITKQKIEMQLKKNEETLALSSLS